MVGTSVRERLRQGAEALLNRGAREVEIDKIELDPEQPRKSRDPQRAAELAESVRSQGVLSPLLVTLVPGVDRYRIVFGERRFRAAQEAGLQSVPCVVRESLDPLQVLVIQLTENLQREDPRPLEVAASMARLEDPREFGLRRSEIARLLGRSPSWVTNMLSLLAAEGQAREALEENLLRDTEATRLFEQLPQDSQDALLAEARASNQPIRRSAVRQELAAAAVRPAPAPDALPDPSEDESEAEDDAPDGLIAAAPQPASASAPTASPPPAPAPEPAAAPRRGRPARQAPRLFELPSLSWDELGRLFDLLDLRPPSDPSELDEAFERLRDALS
jgi:ParB family transcriptional regulator, chromosome partitioning protein